MKTEMDSGRTGYPPLLIPLGLALLGAAVNYWFSLELAFGISFLVGSPFGILAGILAPWPFGIFGPCIALLPTLVLWAHPWALASVLLEGFMIAVLVRKNQIDRVILYEALYWMLLGAPLVLGQYTLFLGMRLDGALAAATKQGVNAFFAAVFGVVLYYLLKTLFKRRLASQNLPDAREYFTLFLEVGFFLPVLLGVLLYTADRKEQVLIHSERETSIILSLLIEQGVNYEAPVLVGMLGTSGHQASILDRDGVLIWSTAENPRLLFSGGSIMHRYGNAVIVGSRAESNPMKRWSGALVRAEHEYGDGNKLVVTQSLATQVADLNSRLTTIFGFLLVWLAGAAGTAFIAATLLVRPLERLRKVAEQVQKGESEIRWPSFGVLEIQELRDSLVAMTGAMEQRGIALSEAMHTAEAQMKRGEGYLAFMGHELKAPLAALSSALAAEELGAEKVSPETMRESLSRLLELIDDILDQARSGSGPLRLRSEPFDPAHEAASLLEAFAIQARRKSLRFDLYIGEALATTVAGDPLRYRQVIANLVSNAVKYTPKGRVSVSLEGRRSGGQLVVTGKVEDTGIGIAPDRMESIWIPFYSAGNRNAEGQSSHGLGLSIVRNIVEAMSGSIDFESDEGKGSVFRLLLAFPLVEKVSNLEQLPSGSLLADAKPDLRGIRVLVADDERISRMAVSHFLRSWGATVDEVESGVAALEAHATTAYSLFVLDEHMPGLGGRDVIRQIRAREKKSGRSPSFLILSSAESSAAGMQEPEAPGIPPNLGGPDAYLPKPVQQPGLIAVLRQAGRW